MALATPAVDHRGRASHVFGKGALLATKLGDEVAVAVTTRSGRLEQRTIVVAHKGRAGRIHAGHSCCCPPDFALARLAACPVVDVNHLSGDELQPHANVCAGAQANVATTGAHELADQFLAGVAERVREMRCEAAGHEEDVEAIRLETTRDHIFDGDLAELHCRCSQAFRHVGLWIFGVLGILPLDRVVQVCYLDAGIARHITEGCDGVDALRGPLFRACGGSNSGEVLASGLARLCCRLPEARMMMRRHRSLVRRRPKAIDLVELTLPETRVQQ